MPSRQVIKMTAYVARDSDGYLAMYTKLPTKDSKGNWGGTGAVKLPIYMWPELQTSHGAIEVEVKVARSRRRYLPDYK